MSKIFFKASKEQANELFKLGVNKKINAYEIVYPLPNSFECEITVAKGNETKYIFIPTKTSNEADLWGNIFKQWISENFNLNNFSTLNQLQVKLVESGTNSNSNSANDSSNNFQNNENERSDDGLIKGEGLASFSAQEPRYKLDRLIVSEELLRKLVTTINVIKNTKKIYEDWGFNEVDSFPRAILNFYGPPGTGKTMAAHAIAEKIGKKIIVANFAEIESKYVGDSPKNLENIFTTAKNEDALLFFDEADSFLGKRLTSISSSSDQAVNSLRSKLLQLLEDHLGIVIFCTNLIKNYDAAFESRILRSLEFPLPDKECRKRLICQMIPGKTQSLFADGESLNNETLDKLADLTDEFSGREIKNAVLQTLCDAAERGVVNFHIADFEKGFKDTKAEIETRKKAQGKLSKKDKEKLEKQINENLKTGNYAKEKDDKDENSAETDTDSDVNNTANSDSSSN